MSIRVGIVGISGFGGGEAMRLIASHPAFEAIALRSTRRAVLDAGDTRIGADFGAPRGRGSYRNELETINPAREKPRHAATTPLLSGSPTSKSP